MHVDDDRETRVTSPGDALLDLVEIRLVVSAARWLHARPHDRATGEAEQTRETGLHSRARGPLAMRTQTGGGWSTEILSAMRLPSSTRSTTPLKGVAVSPTPMVPETGVPAVSLTSTGSTGVMRMPISE